MLWDIFCRVIDNHGDIGVCWRLCAQLARRGERVRLRIDDATALAWMAPDGQAGVNVLAWDSPAGPGDVVIEAFGCELPDAFQTAIAQRTRETGRQPAWINLEYLTAESFAERNHGLRSPLMAGPAKGLEKHFFYPGFTAGTGGLLREADLLQQQAHFDRTAWLARHGAGEADLLVSLFCYEPAALQQLLDQLSDGPQRVHLIVTAGRATQAVRSIVGPQHQRGALSLSYLPLVPHAEFDRLLWSCDLNFVRGEDSLVRALWAGKPFVWQLYPQHDDAHHGKLEAFLDWLRAPNSLSQAHRAWNGVTPALPSLLPQEWEACALDARQRLLAFDDLVTQLRRFVAHKKG